MGNCSSLHWTRERSEELKDRRCDSIDTSPTHEGIKTVGIEKVCEFSTSSVTCVCIVTWNMNGKASSEDLVELIGRDRKFDLLVVGLQEVPKLNVGAHLQAALAETHSLLGEARMQSLQLFVFGPKDSQLYPKETRVDKHSVRGCGGLIGRKKGAVGVYINFNGIRMVFISCHLSAHARNVEERNSQCRHISHSLFAKDRNPYSKHSHLTVWLGDLNYRLQGISTHPARSLIHNNLHSLLTSKDQLLQEAERGQVFSGYCEGILTFKPTYKYNVGSNNYDTSYKVRVPSWTDRILFKIDTCSGIDAVLHSYESIDRIKSSDHKPVKAHLCLKVNRV
ncbi:type IV inositol polyphosphate 5-phosphatase 11 isoform X6 [Canna indica]|uniref:Type IV inositol polyphosphate 5-phosphatase 11 isoform X6 n=1 Tax=Canna indica TaxID=4628 RepID=A0AAQ3KKW8_9LILI|nr:type IV inositol polyphosphate 5-phosphatase 11 isoform X6 [Canna indica]